MVTHQGPQSAISDQKNCSTRSELRLNKKAKTNKGKENQYMLTSRTTSELDVVGLGNMVFSQYNLEQHELMQRACVLEIIESSQSRVHTSQSMYTKEDT